MDQPIIVQRGTQAEIQAALKPQMGFGHYVAISLVVEEWLLLVAYALVSAIRGSFLDPGLARIGALELLALLLAIATGYAWAILSAAAKN